MLFLVGPCIKCVKSSILNYNIANIGTRSNKSKFVVKIKKKKNYWPGF